MDLNEEVPVKGLGVGWTRREKIFGILILILLLGFLAMNYVAQITLKEQTETYIKNWDNCRYALNQCNNGNTQDVYGRYSQNITIP